MQSSLHLDEGGSLQSLHSVTAACASGSPARQPGVGHELGQKQEPGKGRTADPGRPVSAQARAISRLSAVEDCLLQRQRTGSGRGKGSREVGPACSPLAGRRAWRRAAEGRVPLPRAAAGGDKKGESNGRRPVSAGGGGGVGRRVPTFNVPTVSSTAHSRGRAKQGLLGAAREGEGRQSLFLLFSHCYAQCFAGEERSRGRGAAGGCGRRHGSCASGGVSGGGCGGGGAPL